MLTPLQGLVLSQQDPPSPALLSEGEAAMKITPPRQHIKVHQMACSTPASGQNKRLLFFLFFFPPLFLSFFKRQLQMSLLRSASPPESLLGPCAPTSPLTCSLLSPCPSASATSSSPRGCDGACPLCPSAAAAHSPSPS